ncbi:MAG TPA: PTS system mannose/fructose/sorbose family transporter subunit IID [Gemmatimonadaceae bacterium]|nr:PTS system mannose/fructose/sorbose family transporter subunit IID [Gemmatimonadaceae bacterium]
MSAPATRLPVRTQGAMLLRLLAIQGSWNYETLLGNGLGFCLEPALRRLPGGAHSPEFKQALARESRYFNAHPYLAAVAVGALARVELEQEPPERIERFRTALCGPLGSVGDRLVWAGWLPFCSLVSLAAFGLHASPLLVVAIFLGLYNAGHVALLVWGLRTGWMHGMRVASGLAHPVLRQGPQVLAKCTAFAAGVGIPLAFSRVLGPGRTAVAAVVLAAVAGAVLVVKLQGRLEGWRFALVMLSLFVLLSVIR